MATRKKIEPKKASLKQMVDVRELEAKEKVIRLERRVKYYEDTLREAGVMLGIPVKAPSGVPLRTALFHAIGQKDGWATCGKKLCFELEGIATLIGGNPVERLRYVKDRAELLNEVLKAMQITTHPDVVKPAILQRVREIDNQRRFMHELMVTVGLDPSQNHLGELATRVSVLALKYNEDEEDEDGRSYEAGKSPLEVLTEITEILSAQDEVSIADAVRCLKREYDIAMETIKEQEPQPQESVSSGNVDLNEYKRKLGLALGIMSRERILSTDLIAETKKLADAWSALYVGVDEWFGDRMATDIAGATAQIIGLCRELKDLRRFKGAIRNEVLMRTSHEDNDRLLVMLKRMKAKADAWDRHKANRGEEENAEPDLRAAIITQHARLVYLTCHIGNMLIGTDAHNDCFQLAAKWEREGINGGEQKNNSRG